MENFICDTRYLFWILFTLAFFCALAVLGGILGYRTWKDFKYFKRAERQLARRC